jgi:hypothetical protein
MSAEPSTLDISASDAITAVSLNAASESVIGLPSEERYLLMNKDEVTVARARTILAVYCRKALLMIIEIN